MTYGVERQLARRAASSPEDAARVLALCGVEEREVDGRCPSRGFYRHSVFTRHGVLHDLLRGAPSTHEVRRRPTVVDAADLVVGPARDL